MDTEHDSPHDRVRARLRAIIEGLGTPPPWLDAWKLLTPDSRPEDRLAVYRAIRGSGILPDPASFWLVSHLIDEIAAADADEALGEYESRMQAIEDAHRFGDGQVWARHSAPADYLKVRQEYFRAWDALFARKLQEFREPQMARLFREDPRRFDQLSEEGRRFFFGPESAAENEPQVWLQRLMEAVADGMVADGPTGPLGCRYSEEDGHWTVDVFPTPVELLGGAVDGQVLIPAFTLDLAELQGAFEEVEDLTWRSLGSPDDEGPRIGVGGVFGAGRSSCRCWPALRRTSNRG